MSSDLVHVRWKSGKVDVCSYPCTISSARSAYRRGDDVHGNTYITARVDVDPSTMRYVKDIHVSIALYNSGALTVSTQLTRNTGHISLEMFSVGSDGRFRGTPLNAVILDEKRKGKHPRKPRDFQRSWVYRAERAAFGWPKDDYFDTIEDVQAYVDRIVRSRWWKSLTPVRQVHVKGGQGASGLRRGQIGTLKISEDLRYKWVVWHELAHIVTPPNTLHNIPAHGWEFCRTYLKIVDRWGYEGAGKVLRNSFKENRVKWVKTRS